MSAQTLSVFANHVLNDHIPPQVNDMMPPTNKMPAPDQPFPLPTIHVTSNIPKISEKDENWVYPITTNDLDWEALHANECMNPRLASFGGKDKDYSPRARIRHW